MKILKLTLENFRGVKEGFYEFTDRTKISGKNGSGKSTIVSAVFWVFADRDATLTANPMVRPVGAIDEVVTTVTLDCLFGFKPVQIQKSQKLKRSKSGVVSLTNSYMVNSVPKSEKAFKEYLTELGFNFDKFLMCSHPAVLLAGINNKKERTALRNLLFEMADDVTDIDIASNDPELKDVAELLQQYDTEEITAIQNATLRKIRENYGKDGEILRAKIEGLESAKVEIETEKLNSQIKNCEEQIKLEELAVKQLNARLEEIRGMSSEILNKKFRMNKIEQDSVKDVIQKKTEADKNLYMLESQEKILKSNVDRIKRNIDSDRMYAEDQKSKVANAEKWVEGFKQQTFDESKSICPTCGQKLPKEKIDEARANYEQEKKNKIQQYQEQINRKKMDALAAFDRVSESEKEVKEQEGQLKAIQKSIKEAESGLAMFDTTPDLSGNEEYARLQKEVEDIENEISKTTGIKDEILNHQTVIFNLQNEINLYKVELAKEEQNKEIDNKIIKARNAQMKYEQSKANAEMILDQLQTLNMKKNKLLQDSVNSHFSLIKWRLFTQMKNAEFKDACIPTIDGKTFGESMNTGLETMARIDAMNGIQGFFNLDYPIWLDNAEHLDSESLGRINIDHQLIVLCVSDDERLVFQND